MNSTLRSRRAAAIFILFALSLALSAVAEGQTRRRTVRRPTPPPLPQNRLILFDQGHHNFHSLDEKYVAFRELVVGAGWTLENFPGDFELQPLRRGGILVIVNALAPENVEKWSLPTPSAFSEEEIAAVRDFVEEGGGLLLIADHMPFAGAAADLAAAFGVEYSNGFAFDTAQLSQPKTCLAEGEVHVFRRDHGTLADHPITAGIDSVATFTGSALTGDVIPLMIFSATSISLMPQTAWRFPSGTPEMSVAGWSQGAVKEFGRGRIAVFGEAAMFSKQTCRFGTPMGMNSPLAQQNGQFLLNVLDWLSGRIR